MQFEWKGGIEIRRIFGVEEGQRKGEEVSSLARTGMRSRRPTSASVIVGRLMRMCAVPSAG